MFEPEELCLTCPKRSVCSCLCPEAEVYASQDVTPQRELTIGLPRYGSWPESVEKSLFTDLERKVIHALASGKSRKEISKLLNIKRETVRSVIYSIRKKRLE